MKIRNPKLVAAAGALGGYAARGLVRSLHIEYRPLGEKLAPRHLPKVSTERHIYSIWHDTLLLPAVEFAHPTLAVLISGHADGRILGSLISSLRMGCVHGSSTRGGIEAVRKLLATDARRHLAITPDGPRGPRRVMQPGAVYVASRAGMKIVCVGVGYETAWRAKSWDRFAVPAPGSRAVVVTSTPIAVPADAKTATLETIRLEAQAEMDLVTAAAEALARGRRRAAA